MEKSQLSMTFAINFDNECTGLYELHCIKVQEICQYEFLSTKKSWVITESQVIPFLWRCELTPYPQRAHLNYLTLGSFWGQSISSQWTHNMTSHCELSVSLQLPQWVHHAVQQWAHCGSCKLTESSQKAHSVSSSGWSHK